MVGLGAGILSGLFGVGGGVVLVPGFVLFLGLAQHSAHATSLAAMILTAGAALQPFAMDGSVAWIPGVAIASGALVGAVIGASIMDRLSATRLRQAFAVLLVLVALRMLVPIELVGSGAEQSIDAVRALAFAGLGVATGTLSALMGVGGGVILVPAMVLLFEFTQHTAEGTSLLVIVPTAVMGALRHGRRGHTEWRVGLLVGLGGLVGGQIGARIALLLAGEWLQAAFGAFLLLMGVRLLVKSRVRATTETAPVDE